MEFEAVRATAHIIHPIHPSFRITPEKIPFITYFIACFPLSVVIHSKWHFKQNQSPNVGLKMTGKDEGIMKTK
jgi:hypothetical protein